MNNQNNGRALFGIKYLPSDHQIRNLVDDVKPHKIAAIQLTQLLKNIVLGSCIFTSIF
jgi:hypothetical protein